MAKTIIIIEDTDSDTSRVSVQVLKTGKVDENPNADTPANRLAVLVEIYLQRLHQVSLSTNSSVIPAHSSARH